MASGANDLGDPKFKPYDQVLVVQGRSSGSMRPGLIGSAWLPDVSGGSWEPGLDRAVVLGREREAERTSPAHVLLIEDDWTIADMYRLQLEYDGYRVSVASNADSGIQAIAAGQPDIVLLDLLLPDRSGFEVLVEINETFPKHPPVVILSNYGEPSMIEQGMSLGAVEYLVKSRVTPESVSRSIPGWIEQERSGGGSTTHQ